MQFGMATEVFHLPKSSCHLTHRISHCLRSKSAIGDFKSKSIFAINLKLLPPLHPYHEVGLLSTHRRSRMIDWSSHSFVDNNGSQLSTGDEEGGTRLVRTIQAIIMKTNARLKEIRKGLPMKLLFFLVGFYCATAFATVIGQTGDWDILSAGLAVVVVEGIGVLMYRSPQFPLPLLNKLKSLITMFNYWKVGLSLGLFLDAFKYEMDMTLDWCNLFDFEMDVFHIFW